MTNIARFPIFVGAVTSIVMLASSIAIAGVVVKTEDCKLTLDGGECVCTVKAKDDVSITAVYINNAATLGNDFGFTIRDLSLNDDLIPGGDCNLRGIGQNIKGWFDIPRRISAECGNDQAYSPIPLEKDDEYVITLRGFNRSNQTNCGPAPIRLCQTDILLDVRASAHGKFSLICKDDDDDDDDGDEDDDDD